MNANLHTLAVALTGAELLGASAASLAEAVIDPDLEAAMAHGGEVSFIARFSGRVDPGAFPGPRGDRGTRLAALLWALRDQADASQQNAVALLRRSGAKRLVQLWSINALAGSADARLVQALASLPEVDSISLDANLAAPAPAPAADAPAEWNLAAIGAPDLWAQGLTGAGTVVAGMDTGVDALHPDLGPRWRGGSNSWFDPNGEHATPYDQNGHGTQTTSLMVGGDAGGSTIGVAPDARWIAVKVFNDAGSATLSGIHLGFQWLLDPDGDPATADAPDVVNSSWGFPDMAGQCFTEFDEDVSVLGAAGIAVVFSAGNSGTLGSLSPADNPEGFGVGSVDASLSVTWTSSRGPSACDGSIFPEVVAPGAGVRTADLTLGGYDPYAYATRSGTSFAAPQVAGTIALLRQANPEATAAQLTQAVIDGATDIGAEGPDNEAGHGLLSAPGALDALLGASAPPPSCTDADGDGFFAETTCGTPADCDDLDAAINPDACDVKGDGIDQDCDGLDRLKGKSCPVSGGDSGGAGGGGKGKKR